MNNRHRGFTVVELLVVVAVVAALVVLSLPVLGKIRGQSGEITCVNNLKALGQGIFLYTQDHNGRMPPSVELKFPGPIYGSRVPSWGPTWAEYIVATYLSGNKAVLQCPYRPKTWGSAAGYYVDYPYNERFCPQDSGSGEYVGMPLPAIQNPSRKILLGDGGRLSGNTMVGGFYSMSDAYRLFPRHPGNRVNVIYVDLHVQSHHFIQNGSLPPIADPLGSNAFQPAL